MSPAADPLVHRVASSTPRATHLLLQCMFVASCVLASLKLSVVRRETAWEGRVVVAAESMCLYLVVLDTDREMLLKFIVSCVWRSAAGSRSNPWVAKSINNHISGDEAFVHFMAACLFIRVHVGFMSGLMSCVAVVVPECISPYVALANHHLHEHVWRESSPVRAAFLTGVPVGMQMLSLFKTLPSAQPAFPTGQALRWAASPQQVKALTIMVKAWVSTAAKVSGLGGEDLFLALRGAFAAAAVGASSLRSLPWSMRFGALLAFLSFARGSLPLVGGCLLYTSDAADE